MSTNERDAERPEHLNEIAIKEMINKILNIMLDDQRVKVHEIVNILNISEERVFNILHEHLDMKKQNAK